MTPPDIEALVGRQPRVFAELRRVPSAPTIDRAEFWAADAASALTTLQAQIAELRKENEEARRLLGQLDRIALCYANSSDATLHHDMGEIHGLAEDINLILKRG